MMARLTKSAQKAWRSPRATGKVPSFPTSQQEYERHRHPRTAGTAAGAAGGQPASQPPFPLPLAQRAHFALLVAIGEAGSMKKDRGAALLCSGETTKTVE